MAGRYTRRTGTDEVRGAEFRLELLPDTRTWAGVGLVNALRCEGVALNDVRNEGRAEQLDELYVALTHRAGDLAHESSAVPSLAALTMASVRPRDAWNWLLERFNLAGDPRFRLMSLEARKYLAEAIVEERRQGLNDDVEERMIHAAHIGPFLRVAYKQQHAREQERQQSQQRDHGLAI